MKYKLHCVFSLILAAMLTITSIPVLAYSTDIKVFLNGKQLSFDVPPLIVEGRTLVPLRSIFEALGAVVEWNNEIKTVNITKSDISIALSINSYTVNVNGMDSRLDVPAKIIGERTFIPLRFISENLGLDVSWDSNNNAVIISERGNSFGNIVNGGHLAQYGDWLYFNIDEVGLCRCKIDGSEKSVLVRSQYARNINIVDGWIYFEYSTKENSLFKYLGYYKINIDGSNMQKVSGDLVDYVNINGEWIYYANAGDDYRIYKVKTDGSNRQRVTVYSTHNINVVGDWIYFQNDNIGNSLYKIKTDGSDMQKICNDGEYRLYINVCGEWIYYCAGSGLYKIKTDGSQRTLLVEGPVSDVNVFDSWIYFSNLIQGSFCKVRTDGTSYKKLFDGNIADISITKNCLLYGTYVFSYREPNIEINGIEINYMDFRKL